MKRLPSDGPSTGQAWLAFVFTQSCEPERRDEIVDYVNTSFAKLQAGARIVRQAIEGMDQCIARRKLVEPELRSWLAAGRPSDSAGSSTAAKSSR